MDRGLKSKIYIQDKKKALKKNLQKRKKFQNKYNKVIEKNDSSIR